LITWGEPGGFVPQIPARACGKPMDNSSTG
jgi:hypothetical protein